MSIKTAYTLEEAIRMRDLSKEALEELTSGQAKSYRIGTREFTAFDMADLRKQIEFFSNIIDAKTGQARSTSVALVRFRDL